jgi:hypothetical protein
LHLASGFPFPHLDKLEYKLLVKGLAKLNPFIPRQALPITPQILLDMFKVMKLSDPVHATLWCAFTIGFFLFARKSNLVPPSPAKFDKNKHLCRRDIIIGHNQILVYIKWSKTIQTGNRYILIPLVSIPGSPLCPRAAAVNMFCRVKASPEEPAFSVPSGEKLITLTHASFTRHLRNLLLVSGHNPKGFSGHSFRRGGASFALLAGVPGELIMAHGDWRSQCYLRYLDKSIQDQSLVTKLMAKACAL